MKNRADRIASASSLRSGRSIARLLLAFLGLAANTSHAQWQGYAAGRIQSIEATHLNNFAFRVWLEGSPQLCNAGHRWAYVDGNGTNYKVFIATLLAAKARGASVALYTLHDASGQNYCRIEHISSD